MVANELCSSHGVGRQPPVQRARDSHGRTWKRLCANLEPRRRSCRHARKRAAAHGAAALDRLHYLMPQFYV